MMSSLDTLVMGSIPEDMKIIEKLCKDGEKRKLLLKKGIYLYEYLESFERFAKIVLPAKEEFFLKLSGKEITNEEYPHAKGLDRVWVQDPQQLPRPVRAD